MNNYATTEAEISTMALRLAAAGTQVGMSEADILGLSTALSSLGVEAESGGSSISKILINMQLASSTGLEAMVELESATGLTRRELELMASNNSGDFKSLADAMGMTTSEMQDIMKASKNLENFAEVAGMSGEEFQKAFGEDAIGAMMAFIDGLGGIDTESESAIEKLDAMGISEIRLRDALLRLAGNSDLVTEAVGSSNKAWEENTALQDEATLRYETVQSQLQILRNKLVDVAVSAGEELLPAIIDLVDMAEPLIDSVKEAVKRFSELDEGTKKNIIRLGGFVMAGGPVLKFLAGFTTNTGKLTGALGKGLKAITGLDKPVEEIGGKILDTSKNTGLFTTGIGKLVGGIGKIHPAVGIAVGAIAAGVVVWELWGEEAWNSAKRVRDWGFDVGETTASTLTEIKGFSDDAQGQFSLMTQGLSGNTEEMGTNFANMGEVIESSLNERIINLDSLIENLPDTVRTALTKLLEEDKKQAEQSLAIIEENNAEIARIRQAASDNERDLTIHDLARIRAIQQESNEAYIDSLKVSDDEKRQLMEAMNGDVENASREQAESWVKGLAEQRVAQNDHYNTNKNEYRKHLEEMGYSSDAIAEHMRVWELAQKSATDGIDQQLALLVKKYPELAEIVSFETGKLINAIDQNYDIWIARNRGIIDSAIDLSAQVTANAQRNADALAWQTDGTRDFEKAWANIVLDEQTAQIKTNVREAIVEAGASNEQWNNMKFMLHNAELDSNAKQMIGEAAIVNGYWDGMAWEEKEIILKDEFSVTMFKALEDSEIWNELPIEAKTALMYSNTPEIMAQTMLDFGLWEDFKPQIKEMDADNFEVLDAISKSEAALSQYDALEPELKKLLAEDPATLTYDQSRKALEQYENLEPELKKLLGDNTQVQDKVAVATEKLSYWNKFHIKQRQLPLETNVPTVSAEAQRAIDRVTGKTVELNVRFTSSGYSGVRSQMDQAINAGAQRMYAKGTNYHPGGLAVLGDGGKREPYLTPQGSFGISPSNDTMYALPEGTRVWSSIAKFRQEARQKDILKPLLGKLPHYATGTDFSFMDKPSQQVNQTSSSDNYNIYLTANGDLPDSTIKKMATKIEREIKNIGDRRKTSIGRGVTY